MRSVRIVLLGDDEEFVALPPATILPEVTVPSAAGSNATLHIVDTSPRREDRPHLESEVRRAHVVCVVYAIDDPQSFDRVVEYWLPTLRSLGVNLPVILVANKIDLRQGEVAQEALEDEVLPIMADWKEVETVCVNEVRASLALAALRRQRLEVRVIVTDPTVSRSLRARSSTFPSCSARRIADDWAEVADHASRACLFPTAPIYDTREHTLKPACIAALQRIFRLCDVDVDGLLSDHELNRFQRKCFGTSLQQSELDGLKAVARAHDPAAASEDGLSESGFLLIHSAFVQQGRLETTWQVLREFGYGEDLALRESFLSPRVDVPSDCSVEISPAGFAFLTALFERHDRDQDGALSDVELDELFAVSPGNPWLQDDFPATTVTNDAGHVTLQGWLAQWALTTLLDHRVTLKWLAYLGFGALAEPPLPLSSALKLSVPRKIERRTGKVQRNVFLVFVLGGAGCGKTSLLSSFLGKRPPSRYEPTSAPRSVVNSIEFRGSERYLVLQEFGRHEAEVLRNSKRLNLADMLLFCYDSADTNSFSYISNLRQQFKLDSVPSVFVATKSDLDLAQQRHEVQPEEYCARLSLRPPVAVSRDNVSDLFAVVVATVLLPGSSIPGGADRRAAADRLTSALWTVALVSGTSTALWLAWRHYVRPAGGLPALLNAARAGMGGREL